MAFRQQIQSRTYPRLCRFQGGKNLCESKEYGEITIACGMPVCGRAGNALGVEIRGFSVLIRPAASVPIPTFARTRSTLRAKSETPSHVMPCRGHPDFWCNALPQESRWPGQTRP